MFHNNMNRVVISLHGTDISEIVTIAGMVV